MIPYLCVDGAKAALQFYADAFGAQIDGTPYEDGGRIGHAAMRIGDALFFLADEFPQIGLRSPKSLGASSASVVIEVSDVDAFMRRAGDAGANVTQAPKDKPYGRTAKLEDPFGQRWIVNQTER